MFISLDSIASVVGIFMYMYLTISKFKQLLRSRKGLDYNTGRRSTYTDWDTMKDMAQYHGSPSKYLAVGGTSHWRLVNSCSGA